MTARRPRSGSLRGGQRQCENPAGRGGSASITGLLAERGSESGILGGERSRRPVHRRALLTGGRQRAPEGDDRGLVRVGVPGQRKVEARHRRRQLRRVGQWRVEERGMREGSEKAGRRQARDASPPAHCAAHVSLRSALQPRRSPPGAPAPAACPPAASRRRRAGGTTAGCGAAGPDSTCAAPGGSGEGGRGRLGLFGAKCKTT